LEKILQLALDFVDLPRAIKVAREAVEGGIDWVEVGTPLIKSEGVEAIRKLRQLFPKKVIVADMKIMDAGRVEVESALKAGANIVDVLGVAHNQTIQECIEAARNYGGKIVADLINVKNAPERAKELEKLGVDYITVHIAIDEQMMGRISFEVLKEVRKAVSLPLGIAGGLNSENVVEALESGAEIIIVGGAISKAADACQATRELKEVIETHRAKKVELYKRVGAGEVKEIFFKVSTANISDALHRGGVLKGFQVITPGVKLVGQALTVRTYPGDWAKPVEAIELAEPGSVIVIDAGGVEPAVWGELATYSALQKKLAGVVIHGAIRDTEEIKKLSFPAFAKLTFPGAYEPKGFGEIGVPINISGQRIFTGDWIIGDSDGVVCVSKARVVEIANRAMDVLEKENRIREEIKRGGTLSEVTELLKWEKK
jgi:3-hexulose-6-phosphate synthase/6-phospho-3-hexuloisomerase